METLYTDLLNRLAAIPERIQQVVQGRNQSDYERHPFASEWSLVEIFAHIRASDDIIAPRVLMILTRERPAFMDFDERRWAELAGYIEADINLSLQTFTLRRAELVRTLKGIAPGAWERIGIHEINGPQTLRMMLQGFIAHEEGHCQQIEALWARK
ncbi:DinB family protein [Tengunoibacter tsumagoiensis]|uniref:DinB-like domain-containing protein n=1 Tax=Tengunoibacter tsumagoiensis TaxID=2014871 RepID=A0A401ZX37_9CHLR|nr:DinB family protein [Tengunoibacter tsumagoiensis]GCE11406.1 hypothetical protein KTT_12650 [Tengunoibacter tsumagoiensis]